MFEELRNEIQNAGTPERAKASAWFFKTGKGQYGEGDIFVGISVPDQRKIALRYKQLPLQDITKLLMSKIHEERLIALLILVSGFTKGSEEEQKNIFEFYITHTKYINNWDLVDLSADKIVGEYLYSHRTSTSSPLRSEASSEENVLIKLVKSENMWERRIAMIATYTYIKNGEAELAFKIADILINDKQDLIQKAVGWMLREVGKRVSQEIEEEFLKIRYKTMPRTALRYAIEKFSPERRKQYLEGSV